MTPRRWRRRIRVTSSRGASGSLIPSDLRIRLPQVHRYQVRRPVGLLADEPRGRQADQRRGPRVRERGRGQFHTGVYLLELLPVQDGTVADEQHLVALDLELGGQRVRRGPAGLPTPPDAAPGPTKKAR